MTQLSKRVAEQLENNEVNGVFELDTEFCAAYQGPDKVDDKEAFKQRLTGAIAKNISVSEFVITDPTVEVIQVLLEGLINKRAIFKIKFQGKLSKEVVNEFSRYMRQENFPLVILDLACVLEEATANELANLVDLGKLNGFVFGPSLPPSAAKILLRKEVAFLGVSEGIDESIFKDAENIERLQETPVHACGVFGRVDRAVTGNFLLNIKKAIKSLCLQGDVSNNIINKFLKNTRSSAIFSHLCIYDSMPTDALQQMFKKFSEYSNKSQPRKIMFKAVNNTQTVTAAFQALRSATRAENIKICTIAEIFNLEVLSEILEQLQQQKNIVNLEIGELYSSEQVRHIIAFLQQKDCPIGKIIITRWQENVYFDELRASTEIEIKPAEIKFGQDGLESNADVTEGAAGEHTGSMATAGVEAQQSYVPSPPRREPPPPPQEPVLIDENKDYKPSAIDLVKLNVHGDGTCAFHSIAAKLALLIRFGYLDEYAESPQMQELVQRFADYHPNFKPDLEPATWANLKEWLETYTDSHLDSEWVLGPVLRYWHILRHLEGIEPEADSGDYSDVSKQLAMAQLREEHRFAVDDEQPSWVARALGLGMYLELPAANGQGHGWVTVEPQFGDKSPAYYLHIVHGGASTQAASEIRRQQQDGDVSAAVNGFSERGHYDVRIEQELLDQIPEEKRARYLNERAMLYNYIDNGSEIFQGQFIFPKPEDFKENFEPVPEQKKSDRATYLWRELDRGEKMFIFVKNKDRSRYWGEIPMDERKALLAQYHDKSNKGCKSFLEKNEKFLTWACNHPEVPDYYNELADPSKIPVFHNSKQVFKMICIYLYIYIGKNKDLVDTLAADWKAWQQIKPSEHQWLKQHFAANQQGAKPFETQWLEWPAETRAEYSGYFSLWKQYADYIKTDIKHYIEPQEGQTVCASFFSLDDEQREKWINAFTEWQQIDPNFSFWFKEHLKKRQELNNAAPIDPLAVWQRCLDDEIRMENCNKFFKNWQAEQAEKQRQAEEERERKAKEVEEKRKANLERRRKAAAKRREKAAPPQSQSTRVEPPVARVAIELVESCTHVFKVHVPQSELEALSSPSGERSIVIVLEDFKTISSTKELLLAAGKKGINTFVLGKGCNVAACFTVVAFINQHYDEKFYLHISSELSDDLKDLVIGAFKPNQNIELSAGKYEVQPDEEPTDEARPVFDEEEVHLFTSDDVKSQFNTAMQIYMGLKSGNKKFAADMEEKMNREGENNPSEMMKIIAEVLRKQQNKVTVESLKVQLFVELRGLLGDTYAHLTTMQDVIAFLQDGNNQNDQNIDDFIKDLCQGLGVRNIPREEKKSSKFLEQLRSVGSIFNSFGSGAKPEERADEDGPASRNGAQPG